MDKIKFRDFNKHIVAQNSLTPDLPILNDHENQYVFVYGTLKQGGPRALLNPRDKVAVGRTLTPMYEMRRYGPGSFPVVMRPCTKEDAGYVNGEIYLVKTSAIPTLDRIESNGYLYVRKATRIWSYTTEEAITAWMYETLPTAFNHKHLDDDNISIGKINGYHCYNWIINHDL